MDVLVKYYMFVSACLKKTTETSCKIV